MATDLSMLGELRHINKLRFWHLDAVLNDKYLFPKDEADAIAAFLNPMLCLTPEKRAKASDLVNHAWMDGISVQGEFDVIKRIDEEESRRRLLQQRRLIGSSSSGNKAASGDGSVGRESKRARSSAAAKPNADAMKPVEDSSPHTAEDNGDSNEQEKPSVQQPGHPLVLSAPPMPIPNSNEHPTPGKPLPPRAS